MSVQILVSVLTVGLFCSRDVCEMELELHRHSEGEICLYGRIAIIRNVVGIVVYTLILSVITVVGKGGNTVAVRVCVR